MAKDPIHRNVKVTHDLRVRRSLLRQRPEGGAETKIVLLRRDSLVVAECGTTIQRRRAMIPASENADTRIA